MVVKGKGAMSGGDSGLVRENNVALGIAAEYQALLIPRPGTECQSWARVAGHEGAVC